MDNNTIMKPPGGHPSWKNRKKVIFLTIGFCMFTILFILFTGNDLRIYETIAISAFSLLGTVLGFYIAGASWTDVNLEKLKTQKQIAEENKSDPEYIPSLANGKGIED